MPREFFASILATVLLPNGFVLRSAEVDAYLAAFSSCYAVIGSVVLGQRTGQVQGGMAAVRIAHMPPYTLPDSLIDAITPLHLLSPFQKAIVVSTS